MLARKIRERDIGKYEEYLSTFKGVSIRRGETLEKGHGMQSDDCK